MELNPNPQLSEKAQQVLPSEALAQLERVDSMLGELYFLLWKHGESRNPFPCLLTTIFAGLLKRGRSLARALDGPLRDPPPPSYYVTLVRGLLRVFLLVIVPVAACPMCVTVSRS